ncbi:hypothetical protein [Mangrovihabitans endophyticus]|uniref:Uncharacterized protein n=1 Tax=Mangrovihabitans endophyticus TaxID=1751298 RepID=A0A8J3C5C5_9ACTN|nr:hypothetical protein [Mangrovihabitans endophyticus]GGL12882.1 hypothetical protein GCM10012284_54430 [Mangrovihabitans endophyticus]
MVAEPHRVTADHVRALAIADRMRGRRTCLVDSDEGICFVSPEAVLAPGSTVRRLLLSRSALTEDAAASGLSVAAFARVNGGRVAAELNNVLAET